VLAVNEKNEIQVLDRTQPGLPTKKDRAAIGSGMVAALNPKKDAVHVIVD